MVVNTMKKINNDMIELKLLKIESAKTQKLIKGKLVLKDTTLKRMAYVDNILGSTTIELEPTLDYLRRLKVQNAKIKVEMET